MVYSLLEQILRGVKSNLYHTSLFTALTLPDIAGAINSANGKATSEKYKKWFDKYAAKKFKEFDIQYITGEMCYNLRCRLLHEGKSNHEKNIYKKISFVNFDKDQAIANCGVFKNKDNSEVIIDVEKFCINIVNAFYEWLEEAE